MGRRSGKAGEEREMMSRNLEFNISGQLERLTPSKYILLQDSMDRQRLMLFGYDRLRVIKALWSRMWSRMWSRIWERKYVCPTPD